MELIEVKQRVGKSVLIETLRDSGKKVVTVSNGDWFPDIDITIPSFDLVPMMKDIFGTVTKISRKFSTIQQDCEIDYLCFHLQNKTPQEEIDAIRNELKLRAEYEMIHYVMLMHQ
jgi:hypothetical protein